MIKCVVIDDEPWAVELLKSYIDKISSMELVFTASNPIAAFDFLEQNEVDSNYLDIQMPEMTGLQFMEITSGKYPIIITSAYMEYAIKGYEHNVIDYLLKPIAFDRFYKSFQRIEKYKKTLPKPQRNLLPSLLKEYIFIKTDGKLIKVSYDEILYIEGMRDYISIHTLKDKLISLDSISNMEKVLPPSQFLRIHKSYIVALNKIDFIERNRVSIGDEMLPIGQVYKENLFRSIPKQP